MAKFDLDEFAVFPTLMQFERCRKDDLLLVADFFSVSVPQYKTKWEIKSVLYQELLAIGVLPEEDELTSVVSQTDELWTLVIAEA